MRSIKYLIYSVATVAAVFLFAVNALAAGESTSISISPLTFDLAANPGDTVTNELLIRNSGSDPVVISAQAQDFVANGEEGEISLTDNKSTYSLASWIELDNTKFTLPGGKQKSVKFSIVVPYNAEPGGHYASVFAQVSPTLGNATSGSGVGQKIGSLLLLRVAGNAKEAASVESFAATKYMFENGPVEFNLRIKNSGTVHIKPKGLVAITDMFGKKTADINVGQKNVLPGATRHTAVKWENTPKIGKFTATLLAYYGPDNQQITAVTSFWIIPWKEIAVAAVVIMLVLYGLWLLRDRIKSAARAFLKHK